MSDARERLGMAWLIEPMMDTQGEFVRMDDYTWEDRECPGIRRVVVDEDLSVCLETAVGEDLVRSPWEVDASSGEAMRSSYMRAIEAHIATINRHVKSLKGETVWMS